MAVLARAAKLLHFLAARCSRGYCRPLSPTMLALASALETLDRLNVGLKGTGNERHERPHKPVLLLAVLDVIDSGEASSERILWSRSLVARFRRYFEIVKSADDVCSPQLPYFHLRSDGFWEAFRTEYGESRPLSDAPSIADASAGTVWASFIGPWIEFTADCLNRATIREAIVTRYFPRYRDALMGTKAFCPNASALAKADEESLLGLDPRGSLPIHNMTSAIPGKLFAIDSREDVFARVQSGKGFSKEEYSIWREDIMDARKVYRERSGPFKGLWIPAELLVRDDLSHSEMLVAAFVYSFKRGFVGSNACIATTLNLEKRTVDRVIACLGSKGVVGWVGNARVCEIGPRKSKTSVTKREKAASLRDGVEEPKNDNADLVQVPLKRRITVTGLSLRIESNKP
jgi:hypothetical protein